MLRTQDFRITGIIWHELGFEKGLEDFKFLERIINEFLSIRNYGNGLKYTLFIYLIDLPNTIHQEGKYYSKKNQYLKIIKKIDFDLAMRLPRDEYQSLLASTYLSSVEEYKNWKIKDFDCERFYQDLKQLFLDKGLIKV